MDVSVKSVNTNLLAGKHPQALLPDFGVSWWLFGIPVDTCVRQAESDFNDLNIRPILVIIQSYLRAPA